MGLHLEMLNSFSSTSLFGRLPAAHRIAFGADAAHGENRKYGAMFTYFYKAASEKASQTKDSLSLKIYDGDRLIRTLKRKAPKETGLHRWYWNMDERSGASTKKITCHEKRAIRQVEFCQESIMSF